MEQGGCELNVEGLGARALLIRVPEFVADAWDAATPGTVVGRLEAEAGVLHLARGEGAAVVRKLKGKPEKLHADIVIGSSAEVLEDIPDECTYLAAADSITTYLPNLMDPAYRRFLAQQMLDSTTPPPLEGPVVLSVDAAKALEQARVRGGQGEENMFKYYKEEGVRVMQNTGGVSAQQREAASAALFKLFEASADGTLGLREIQQNVHLPPHHLRRLLDQLTEPQRERLGRKSVFQLKQQYRK